jgi:hypothetical protein
MYPGVVPHEARAFCAMAKMFHGTVRAVARLSPTHFKHVSCEEVSLKVIDHCDQLDTAARYLVLWLLPVLARLSRANHH